MKALSGPFVIAILLAVGLLDGAGSQEGSPAAILARAYSAGAKHPYTGVGETEVVFQGRKVSTRVRITHWDASREKIEYLDGDLRGFIVAHDGAVHWHYEPRTRRLRVWEQPEGGTAETGSILLRNYEVKEEGTQTVAGRQAWVLALRCRARRMLAKRLWVDRETYATLGSEDYDCRGLCRSRSMMTQVGFGEVRDTLVAPGGLGCTRLVRDTSIQELPLDQVASRLGFLPRFPGYVPQHFERVGTCLSHCPCGCGALSAQIRYTDGLRSFSVFETNPLHCRCSSRESCARGAHLDKATSCYVKEYGAGAVVSNLQGEQTVVVVVGDLSKEEMIRVGASARTSAESR